jgi:FMN reductase
MSQPFKVVAVSGGLQRPSRTYALVQAVVDGIARKQAVEVELIELAETSQLIGGTLRRDALPASVQAQLDAVESADLLIVGTPTFRASYPGLFKHFFDLVDQNGLIDVPVLLTALRPLFSFFQSLTLPIGVFATDAEFRDYQVADAGLQARIDLAVERALPWLRHRTGTPPQLVQVRAA